MTLRKIKNILSITANFGYTYNVSLPKTINFDDVLGLCAAKYDNSRSPTDIILIESGLTNTPVFPGFETICRPTWFFNGKKPNYKMFNEISNKTADALIKLWSKLEKDYGKITKKRFLDFKDNYKQYISEAAIHEIIR